jgi:hypothetical protein
VPAGQPAVGLLKLKSPSPVSSSRVNVFSRTFVLAGAASPTSSAINKPRTLSPLLMPLVLNMASSFGVSAANDVTGSSLGPVVNVTLTFTSPARATEAEMTTAIKNANNCFHSSFFRVRTQKATILHVRRVRSIRRFCKIYDVTIQRFNSSTTDPGPIVFLLFEFPDCSTFLCLAFDFLGTPKLRRGGMKAAFL